jgi:AraC-like DNA-binding protein
MRTEVCRLHPQEPLRWFSDGLPDMAGPIPFRAARQPCRGYVARTHGGQAQFINRPPPASVRSLAPLLSWLDGNLHRPVSLSDMADRAGMRVRSLSRCFRQQTGTTWLQWLLTARVRRAQSLPELTSLALEQVATGTGFGSAAAFRERFSPIVGTSPRSYHMSFGSTVRSPSGLPAGPAVAVSMNFGLAGKFDAVNLENEEYRPPRHATPRPFSFRGGAYDTRGRFSRTLRAIVAALRGVEHPLSQEVEASTAIHGSLQHLKPIDLALGGVRRPRQIASPRTECAPACRGIASPQPSTGYAGYAA